MYSCFVPSQGEFAYITALLWVYPALKQMDTGLSRGKCSKNNIV